MKKFVSAVVVSALIAVSVSAAPRRDTPSSGRGGDDAPVTRIVKAIKKLFTVKTFGDWPAPPLP